MRLESITWPTSVFSDWMRIAAAFTSTVSVTDPTVIAQSMRIVCWTSSRTSGNSLLENPSDEQVTEYRPWFRPGNV